MGSIEGALKPIIAMTSGNAMSVCHRSAQHRAPYSCKSDEGVALRSRFAGSGFKLP
jgi:hypothetical protein